MHGFFKPVLSVKQTVVLFLLWIGFGALAAQQADVTVLENKVEQLSAQIRTTEDTLKQHQQRLQTILKRVDVLKSSEADYEAIQREMALAMTLSQKIERLQARVDSLIKQNERDKTVLRRFYSQQIDSLRRRLKTENQAAQRERLQGELLALYDKRLRCMPRFNTIHFDPQTLSPPPHDSLGMILRKDYLSLSLAEVDSQLQEVQTAEQTLIRQQKLASKAEIFMDDVNEGLFFGPQDQLAQNNTRSSGIDGGSGYSASPGPAGLTADQLNNRIVTLNRLYDDLLISGSASSDNPLQRQKAERYLKLLKEIKSYLQLYRKIIIEKLDEDTETKN